jgi:putative FmdB family regulatory protein
MPIYSYICQECGNKFDLLVGVNQRKDKPVCKKCGGQKLKKAFTQFGVNKGKETQSGSCYDSSCANGSCPLSRG